MSVMMEDIRFGLRLLRKSPGFTLIAVITLALGIGANSAIFSVVNAVLIRPLPYPASERLVTLWNKYPKMGMSEASWSGPDFADRREADRVFERIGVYTDANLNLTGGGEPERIQGVRVSEGLLPALGVPPERGRFFTPAEDRPGGPAVVLVSRGLWKRRFGGDPDLIGKGITLNGRSHTVIGIMPDGFGFPSPRTEMWVPAALSVEQLDASQRGNEYLRAIARLKIGVTTAAAQAEMDRITVRILERTPAATREYFEGAGWGCT